jgi:hypothetical protein
MLSASPQDKPLFAACSLWGSGFLPRDILPSPGNIRRWAFESGLITEPDRQLLTQEDVELLHRFLDQRDRLALRLHIYRDSEGSLSYFKRPHLPIRSLVRRGTEVQLVYWAMRPTVWTAERVIKEYGEVRLGFWCPGTSPLEFCSESTAKLVVAKFKDLYERLSDQCPSVVLDDGSLGITVDGEVSARFFKSGRLFDVELIQPSRQEGV